MMLRRRAAWLTVIETGAPVFTSRHFPAGGRALATAYLLAPPFALAAQSGPPRPMTFLDVQLTRRAPGA